jgi:lysophospholipase L1-like esterase
MLDILSYCNIILSGKDGIVMKTIVCYGDSNTWGARPEETEPKYITGLRYPKNERWTGILENLLGEDYSIVEEGLNGRTSALDDPLDKRRNGLKYISIAMFTDMPADLVIIMLGTNDTKEHLCALPYITAKGVEQIINEIKTGGYGPKDGPPEILIISPVHIRENIGQTWLADELGNGCVEKSRGQSAALLKVANDNGCHFLDAALYAKASVKDAVHIDAENHRKLAEAIASKIKNEIF